MAAPPDQTLTITGPNGQPQLVSLITLPITAAELALALANLPPPQSRMKYPLFLPLEILVCIRRKVEADTEQNKNRERELFLDKKKRRVPTDDLFAGGQVKKMK
ncbi:hypothetical protein FPRO05_02175 [Fusarium proliferatum]|uniref:Uncharacterized protein n=1 Tax=Gibberella intermedia TaxID=948311 RepID=A0A365N9H4_GIBIN|nr:hypothetical protein FPRO05_02175 [Fusarium proliferatum]